mmetsp:Transcript_39852/g.58536  ORF Transcript_39852/g.58536 Transcript_39852/m.58536 type:complete len:264 (+) Transcript_39852:1234-2025(+)
MYWFNSFFFSFSAAFRVACASACRRFISSALAWLTRSISFWMICSCLARISSRSFSVSAADALRWLRSASRSARRLAACSSARRLSSSMRSRSSCARISSSFFSRSLAASASARACALSTLRRATSCFNASTWSWLSWLASLAALRLARSSATSASCLACMSAICFCSAWAAASPDIPDCLACASSISTLFVRVLFFVARSSALFWASCRAERVVVSSSLIRPSSPAMPLTSPADPFAIVRRDFNVAISFINSDTFFWPDFSD